MKVRLLKRLRQRGRGQITIYSVTKTTDIDGEFVTGMEIGINDPAYRGLFDFGDSEEDVLRKAKRIYIENYLLHKSK